jgi:hypothetical protein
MGVALVLNQSFKGRGLVRTITLIPWALPTALMGLAWAWIFNDQFGVVNDILMRLGIINTGITWLGDPTLAMVAVVLADVWKTTPFIAILLLAGLQSISTDLYEAHSIDGATPWQSFWKITIPLLMPQIVIALLFRFAQAFGIFRPNSGDDRGRARGSHGNSFSLYLRYRDALLGFWLWGGTRGCNFCVTGCCCGDRSLFLVQNPCQCRRGEIVHRSKSRLFFAPSILQSINP